MIPAAIKDDLTFSHKHPRVRASIALLLASLLLLVIVGAGYWWPASNASENLISGINAKRLEISSADSNARIAKASGRAVQQLARIEKKLDASVTQAALVQNLAALARRHHVKIISESYEEGKSKDGYASLTHELTLQAAYPELRSFIDDLQGLPTFTIVQEANIGYSSNSSAIRAQLDMITYRRTAGSQP